MITLNNAPKISVIMSVYNGEEYLSATLESIIRQTFNDWELVVINDCSTDSTISVLTEYAAKDPRIKVHTNEVNLRLPASLNKAVSLSRGKYIARMDADDICLPKRLEKQYKFMEENKDVQLSSCRFMTLRNGVYSSGGCGARCDNEALRTMLLVTNPILHPGVIAKADIMKAFAYNPECTCTEDLNLWTRLALSDIKMQIQPEYLLIYRLHDKQITSTTLEKQRNEVLKIQKNYFGSKIAVIDEKTEDFYIDGIYFKNIRDINKFCSFFENVRKTNKIKKSFSEKDLKYAFFEVLAEYKRRGISKKDLLKAMLKLGPLFVFCEILRRKSCAAKDGKACIRAASEAGLVQTSGTKLFPIFSETKQEENQ